MRGSEDAADSAGYVPAPGSHQWASPTCVVPFGLLGRDSFTWRFWRTPSWTLVTGSTTLVNTGMTVGMLMDSNRSRWMILPGLIVLLLWTAVLSALVGRTRGDAAGLHVRTLFGSCHLRWEDAPGALRVRSVSGAKGGVSACVDVEAPGGGRRLDMPGTWRCGFSSRVHERAERDSEGILAWAVAQGYIDRGGSRARQEDWGSRGAVRPGWYPQ